MSQQVRFTHSLIRVLTVGSRHISMSSYQASRDDELSFVKGAVVRVTKKYGDGWWLVRYVACTSHIISLVPRLLSSTRTQTGKPGDEATISLTVYTL